MTAQPEPQAPSEVHVASHRSAAVHVAATLPRWSGRRKGQAARQPEGTMRPLSTAELPFAIYPRCRRQAVLMPGHPSFNGGDSEGNLNSACRAVPCRAVMAV